MRRPLCESFAIHHEKTREPCRTSSAGSWQPGARSSASANHPACGEGRTEIIIEDAHSPIRDRESQIAGVVLVFRDITPEAPPWMEDELLQGREAPGPWRPRRRHRHDTKRLSGRTRRVRRHRCDRHEIDLRGARRDTSTQPPDRGRSRMADAIRSARVRVRSTGRRPWA